MEKLFISETDQTVEVNFDPHSAIWSLTGSSYPESAMEFFQPVFDWTKDFFVACRNSVHLHVRLNYVNSSSSKSIIDFFELLNTQYIKGHDIKIFWYYEADDEDLCEMGQEMLEDLQLPYEFCCV